MDLISYSQCNEDAFLFQNYFLNKKGGHFIELGALDGELYSNTKMFEEFLDLKGVLIEPHPYQFEKLKIKRPNSFLFNELVSNQTDELLFKYFYDGHAAVSGVKHTLPSILLDMFHDNSQWEHLTKGEIYLKPKTLTEILHKSPFEHFDFLSLDVEGHEYEVLQSWDFSIPIDVIMFESLGVEENDKKCEEYLLNHGYHFDTNYRHNKIFVKNGFTKSV